MPLAVDVGRIDQTLSDYESDIKRMTDAGLLVDSSRAADQPVEQTPDTPEPPTRPRSWHLWLLLTTSVLGAVVVGVIGFAGSYSAVQRLAIDHGISPAVAHWVPIGVDAGIAAFLCLDLALAMMRLPVPALRPAAHLLTAATVWFNAAGAWGRSDWTGTGLHAVLPALFVIGVESGRNAVAQLAGIEDGTRMDGVRLSRWLLAPLPTFLLWRRMRLWEITSYTDALKLERLRRACARYIRQRYGKVRKAPVEVCSYRDDVADGTVRNLDRDQMLAALAAVCDEADANARAMARNSRRSSRKRRVYIATTLVGKGKQATSREKGDADERPLRLADLAKVRRAARVLGGADKLSVRIVKDAVGGGQNRYLIRLRNAVQEEDKKAKAAAQSAD
ncbi:DUF2637 domain-containing protein [Streptomyces monashensis]|uniref:DUF2637 domain-containing protein n=1 Tax=Streptomyces monashensis TaxID=1678012 RepID=A0A1S2QPZ2_9ACTN|nr:DUF2637 domain-containing protein [Streptomyces monashensis]OIK08208.1 hypothetical protein BIV23_00220 [Streptomyces monashensis]